MEYICLKRMLWCQNVGVKMSRLFHSKKLTEWEKCCFVSLLLLSFFSKISSSTHPCHRKVNNIRPFYFNLVSSWRYFLSTVKCIRVALLWLLVLKVAKIRHGVSFCCFSILYHCSIHEHKINCKMLCLHHVLLFFHVSLHELIF